MLIHLSILGDIIFVKYLNFNKLLDMWCFRYEFQMNKVTRIHPWYNGRAWEQQQQPRHWNNSGSSPPTGKKLYDQQNRSEVMWLHKHRKKKINLKRNKVNKLKKVVKQKLIWQEKKYPEIYFFYFLKNFKLSTPRK